MIRKIWLGLMLALLVSVIVGGVSNSQAATCRRFTVWIGDDPWLSHPICFDLPVQDPAGVSGGSVQVRVPNHI